MGIASADVGTGNLLFYDVGSVIICLLAAIVIWWEWKSFRECKGEQGRWVFLVNLGVAALVMGIFIASVFRLFDGSYRITPEIGRPAYALLLMALALGAIFQHRHGGNCP